MEQHERQVLGRTHHAGRIWLGMVLMVSLAFALGFLTH